MIRFSFALILAAAVSSMAGAQTGDVDRNGQAQQVSLAPDRAGRMTVDVTIDGKGPFPFVVDTGSERTVVSRELAARLSLTAAGTGRLHSITQTTPVDLVHVGTLDMYNRHRATDLRAPVMEGANLGGAGLIGIDSLQRRRVMIDFRARVMTIQPPMGQHARLSDNEVVIRAQKRNGRLVLMDASIDGEDVAVILDTGSQITLGNEALKRKLFARERNRPSQPIVVRDVTGGTITATYTTTRLLRIDTLKFAQMPIALADAQVFRELGFGDRPALLLGMDALQMFDKVSIDFLRRTAHFVMPKRSARTETIRMAALDSSMLR